MATKKQKRERMQAKRRAYEKELKESGLRAQREDHQRKELQKQMTQREKTTSDIRAKGAKAVQQILGKAADRVEETVSEQSS